MIVYLLNIVFGCGILHFAKDKKLWLIPFAMVLFIWTFIAGGQYDIGTDYFSYMEYFSTLWGNTRFESLFQLCSSFLFQLGIQGQDQFYFYSGVNFIVLFFIGRKIDVKHWGIYYFLIVVVSTFFNNQMNLIRQAAACVFVFAAIVEPNKLTVKKIVLYLIAFGFHRSSILFVPFIFWPKIIDIVTKKPQRLLLFAALFSLITVPDSINIYILRNTRFLWGDDYYLHYISTGYATRSIALSDKIVKLLLWPFIMWSTYLLDKNNLNEFQKHLLRVGIFSYCARLMLLITPLFARFSYYFMLPSIIPLYYLFSNMFESPKQRLWSEVSMLFLFMIYLVKIWMPLLQNLPNKT